MKYFLSLGSNLGHRPKNLAQAISFLEEEGVRVSKASSLYETQPVGLAGQPWFFNQVVEVETGLDPHELLRLAKRIEKKMGRKFLERKGPRIIDIDILLAEQTIIQTDKLIIPHPRMESRNFVLVPLREISPSSRHPIMKATIEDLCRKSKDTAAVRKIDK